MFESWFKKIFKLWLHITLKTQWLTLKLSNHSKIFPCKIATMPAGRRFRFTMTLQNAERSKKRVPEKAARARTLWSACVGKILCFALNRKRRYEREAALCLQPKTSCARKVDVTVNIEEQLESFGWSYSCCVGEWWFDARARQIAALSGNVSWYARAFWCSLGIMSSRRETNLFCCFCRESLECVI